MKENLNKVYSSKGSDSVFFRIAFPCIFFLQHLYQCFMLFSKPVAAVNFSVLNLIIKIDQDSKSNNGNKDQHLVHFNT